MMKNQFNNDHERARMLLALGETDGAGESAWLTGHLEQCEACRVFSQESTEVIGALRSIPVAASRSLVTTTQARVRQRARELQRRRERLWLVAVSCTLVTLTAILTNVVCWRGFEWLVEHSQVSAALWPLAFVGLWIVPALGASVLLLAHGTHLADHEG